MHSFSLHDTHDTQVPTVEVARKLGLRNVRALVLCGTGTHEDEFTPEAGDLNHIWVPVYGEKNPHLCRVQLRVEGTAGPAAQAAAVSARAAEEKDPCTVLWCGEEDLTGVQDWGYNPDFLRVTWGLGEEEASRR